MTFIAIISHYKNKVTLPFVFQVIHDCKNDSANLFHQFGITLVNIFDTQVKLICLTLKQFSCIVLSILITSYCSSGCP